MAQYEFDQAQHKQALVDFFDQHRASINDFGSKVNQTFEAFTFAQCIKWYRNKGWSVSIQNPVINGRSTFRLKYSTRGKPENYSYALCEKGGEYCQIRHQLRVETFYGKLIGKRFKQKSNIVCDIAIIDDVPLGHLKGSMHCFNKHLISFCECKHMSAYAELLASFIGLVHELLPKKLRRVRVGSHVADDHLPPCLHISQSLYPTAAGVLKTIEKRKYDVDVYWHGQQMV